MLISFMTYAIECFIPLIFKPTWSRCTIQWYFNDDNPIVKSSFIYEFEEADSLVQNKQKVHAHSLNNAAQFHGLHFLPTSILRIFVRGAT